MLIKRVLNRYLVAKHKSFLGGIVVEILCMFENH